VESNSEYGNNLCNGCLKLSFFQNSHWKINHNFQRPLELATILPDFIPRRTSYESVNYGISNYLLAQSERAHQDFTKKEGCSETSEGLTQTYITKKLVVN